MAWLFTELAVRSTEYQVLRQCVFLSYSVTLISLRSGLLSPFCYRREREVFLFNDAGQLLRLCSVGDVWMGCEFGPLVE